MFACWRPDNRRAEYEEYKGTNNIKRACRAISERNKHMKNCFDYLNVPSEVVTEITGLTTEQLEEFCVMGELQKNKAGNYDLREVVQVMIGRERFLTRLRYQRNEKPNEQRKNWLSR